MKLFETERLVVRSLHSKDQSNFTELLSDPNIINPIPQAPLSEVQIQSKFSENLNLKLSDLQRTNYIGGIFGKGNPEMIGLCLFLTNDDNDKELGYRLRLKYWGKGYATETTNGMIDYYFNLGGVNKIAADVNIDNSASVRILEKFMNPVKEFFNPERNCQVRRYQIYKHEWH